MIAAPPPREMDMDTLIRRRADGSIDVNFYLARGHLARACQARSLAKDALETVRGHPSAPRMAPARSDV
jgi:hypothetical protein